MKNKNKKNAVKAISALGKTHKIKRNKIKRLADKKNGKKKKIPKKALMEVGLTNKIKKSKANVNSTANDSLVKLTNISFKGEPVNSTASLYRKQQKVEENKTPISFIRRMKDKLKSARFRYCSIEFFKYDNFIIHMIYYDKNACFKLILT